MHTVGRMMRFLNLQAAQAELAGVDRRLAGALFPVLGVTGAGR